MHKFDAAELDYAIRLTVTSDQVGLLPDSLEFICKNFHPQRIQAEPTFQIGRGIDAPSVETEAFISAFREARYRAKLYGFDFNFAPVRLDNLSNHVCGITQDSFGLSADGNVTSCYIAFSEDMLWADQFFYGKPKSDGYVFNLPVLNNLRKQTLDHKEYCQGCFAKWSCSGDCHYNQLSESNGQIFSGSDRCVIIRALTQDQLIENIVNAGGIVWSPAP